AVAAATRGLGITAAQLAVTTDELRPRLQQPRLGLFDVFGGSMPTGWDQWLLLQFEFPVQQVWGDRIAQGDLRKDFAVLRVPTGVPGERDMQRAGQGGDPETRQKRQRALPRFEGWRTLGARATPLVGETALPALRQFVEQGGTLLALGGECEKVIRHF